MVQARKKLDLILSTTLDTHSIEEAQGQLRLAKADYRNAVRNEKSKFRDQRSEKLFGVLSTNPSAAIKTLKSGHSLPKPVQNLKVGSKMFSKLSTAVSFSCSLILGIAPVKIIVIG